MLTKIQKWGNSLGLRIPKAFADQTHVQAGSTVDISLENGQLTIRPVSSPSYRLEELLSGVTRGNLHEEVATGDAVGREAW